jgi:lipopolysaccharide export system protein LptC
MGMSLNIAVQTMDTGTHAWQARGPRDLARLLREARRHSRRVHLMRKAVPSVAIGGLAILVLAAWLNPLRGVQDLPVKVDSVIVSGTKITMEAPKLAGFTRDNRAYNLTADAAAQDFTNPTVLELSGIRSRIEMQNKSIVNMTAVAGVYDTKSELLTLTQYITLISSEGYEARLTEAKAEIKKGYIVSEKPVEVFLSNGKLNANRMEVLDNGELLKFDGGIVLDLKAADKTDKKVSRR